MESLSNNSSQFSSYNSFEQARMNSYLNNMLQFDGNLTDVDDEMASTEKRLETFKGWPESSPLNPMDLVNAGFYYTGSGDEVRCFSCDLQLKEWKHGDSPFAEHRRRMRDCNFVIEYERERLGVTCNPEPASEPETGSSVNRLEDYTRNQYLPYNSQLNYEASTNQSLIRNPSYQGGYIQHHLPVYQEPYETNQQASHCSTGVFVTSQYPHHSNHPVLKSPEEFTTRPNHPSMPGAEQSSTVRMPSVNYSGIPTGYQESVQTSFDRYSMGNVDIPVLNPILQHVPNVQVRTEDTHHTTSQTDLQNNHHRLATFIDWPEDSPVHPWELAAAGFFYMGTGDNVKCYKCRVALRNWEPDDTPWEEHKRWSPDCPLVKERDGHSCTPVEDQEQTTETSNERFHPAPNMPVPRQEPNPNTYMQSEQNTQQQQYSPLQHTQQLHHHKQHPQQQHKLQPQRPEHLPGISKIPLGQSESQHGYQVWGKSPNQGEIENRPLYYSPHTTSTPAPSSTQKTVTTISNSSLSFAGTTSGMQRLNNGSLDDRDFTRVIEMGFSLEDIDNAIARQTERTGRGFANLDDLMQAVLDADNHATSRSPPPLTNSSESQQITETQSSSRDDLRNQLTSAQSFSFEPSNLSAKRALKRSNSAPPGASGSASNAGEQSTRDLDNMQEERLICKICMDAEVGVVFLPCGHISCCPNCASGLDLCPMCRKPIKQRVRTFLS